MKKTSKPKAKMLFTVAATGESTYRDGIYRNDSPLSLQGPSARRYPNAFRSAADESDEDDNEVLPSATSPNFREGATPHDPDAVWRDGQWFNVLDETYLLPVFSNATASRRQATRKAMRSTARLTQHGNDSFEDNNEPERDLGSLSREGSKSPWDSTSPSHSAYNNGSVKRQSL
jgi:sodium/hydrogen exchanger-like protein 6/7